MKDEYSKDDDEHWKGYKTWKRIALNNLCEYYLEQENPKSAEHFAEKINDGTLEEDIKGCNLEKILASSFILDFIKAPEETEEIPNVKEEVLWSSEPIKYKNGGYPGSKRTVIVKTLVGTITASESYASRSFGVMEYPVKKIEDLLHAKKQ